MRFVVVLIAMVVGAIGGIWLSLALFPEASPAGPMLLGGLISFGLGCWAYLGMRAADGLRPTLDDGRTRLVVLAIALGVVTIHVLFLIAAYAIAQR